MVDNETNEDEPAYQPEEPEVATEASPPPDATSLYPIWLLSLEDSLRELHDCTQLCHSMISMRGTGEIPHLQLYVSDPDAVQKAIEEGTRVPVIAVPWSAIAAQMTPGDRERLIWGPVMHNLRAKIAKLTLDVGELNQLVMGKNEMAFASRYYGQPS
jgi:hypothetical protein